MLTIDLRPFHITCNWSYLRYNVIVDNRFEAVSHHLQLELLEIQCDSNYKHLFSTINDALAFHKNLDMTKYTNLRQHAVRMASLF